MGLRRHEGVTALFRAVGDLHSLSEQSPAVTREKTAKAQTREGTRRNLCQQTQGQSPKRRKTEIHFPT